MPRILISYLVHNSGHHAAARALDAALHRLDPGVQTLCVDLLAYTHPYWAAIIQKTYMTTIRRTPEVWEALYDNPVLDLLTRKIRRLIQRGKSKPLLTLMEDFAPDAAICTQAHPFAVLSAYASRQSAPLPLWGVVTDYVPHRFWVTDGPGHYVVPSDGALDRLVWLGVDRSRIHVCGIPIRMVGEESPPATGSDENGQRRVLVMGGSRGLGVKYRMLRQLDKAGEPFTLEVITGANRDLRRRLLHRRRRFKHPLKIRGYVKDAASAMQRATLLLSKPGGLTTAEAIAHGLPMVLVRPLPGQETGNTEFLVRHGAAVLVPHDRHVAEVVNTLLTKPAVLDMMRARARALARPDAAEQISRMVLDHLRRPPGDPPTGP
jgi:processive 1,2-diacylglycerol beta-glucosyltransferase